MKLCNTPVSNEGSMNNDDEYDAERLRNDSNLLNTGYHYMCAA